MVDDDAGSDAVSDDDEENLVQVNHLVDKSIKERAQKNATEWGELSEAVREVYRLYANRGEFSDVGRLELKLVKAEHDRERIQEQIDELTSQLESVKSREDELRERIDEREEMSREYEELLETIESEIRDGASVFPEHGMIQDAAKRSGKSAEGVIDDLQDRNPDLPDAAFVERRKADELWTGTTDT